MMNLDAARAGGEGMISTSKKKKKDDPTEGISDGPSLFQSEDQKVKIKVPDGWTAKG